MSIETFNLLFQQKAFKEASEIFDKLSETEKCNLLEDLFQKSQYQTIPHSVSVLIRELHAHKQFDDFYQAWQPEQDYTKPIQMQSQLFQQFFEDPIRVINGINLQNPREIVSIGLHWTTDEKVQAALAKSEDKSNTHRRDKVAEVANKVRMGIYRVQTDDNLGTPF